MVDALAEAIRLLECGFSVIPIRVDGSKAPALAEWKTYQSRRPSRGELREWLGAGVRRGLAVIGGAVSGNLEILDFDEPGLVDQYRAHLEESGLADLWARLPVAQTPSGGAQLYFRSDAPTPGNRKLAYSLERTIRIETRGEGGYALIPPSPPECHPAGRPYVYTQRHLALAPILTPSERDAVLGAAQEFNEWTPPERIVAGPPDGSLRPEDGGLRPGDDFNARAAWEPLLTGFGLEFKRTSGGTEYWGWAGNGREVCASLNLGGSALLYNFSTNAAPLEPDRAYSKFAFYATVKHGGDWAAAARQLGQEGYGAPPSRAAAAPGSRAAAAPGGPWPGRGGDEGTPEGAESQEEAFNVRPLSAGDKPPTDLTLAQTWAGEVAGRLIYVEGDQWWQYQSGRWHYSSLEVAQCSVQRFLTQTRAVDPLVSVTRGRVTNALFLAKSLLGPHTLSDFDANPNWIPIRNGIYDLESGSLLPHGPERRLTRQSPFDYVPDADCPVWRQFLQQVLITPEGAPFPEWIDAIQEWFGYCLVPDASAQVSMFWVGEGQNGKGTATRVLEKLVGRDFYTSVPIEQLHDPYHRAELYGKMVGFVNEPDPRAMQKNGNWFKAITGGDSITARRPTEKVFTFSPFCRIVVSCNNLPSTRDLSTGYFRRILLIEWRYSVPDELRDNGLDDKLRAELPGIFNWALEGLRRWRSRGGRLAGSQESRALLKNYRMAEDTFAAFYEEQCEKVAGAFTPSATLYARYAASCRLLGETPQTAAQVGRRLARLGIANTVRRGKGGPVRGWQDLQMTTETGLFPAEDG